MKIRTGFVSNSSSSSFICTICGEVESGWDLCLEDAEMCECKKGHCFHVECSLDDELSDFFERSEIEEIEDPKNKGEYIDNPDFNEDARYQVPTKFCPICSFKEIAENNLYRYVLKKIGLKEIEVKTEIKKKFKGGYDEFMKFLEDK